MANVSNGVIGEIHGFEIFEIFENRRQNIQAFGLASFKIYIEVKASILVP